MQNICLRLGFLRILPATAYQLIDKTVAEVIQSSGPLKMSVGILFSLWSASIGVSAIMDTLNATYKVKETRSLIVQYATAVALTTGLTLLAVVSVLLVVLGDQLVGSFGNVTAIAWKIAHWPRALAVLLLALAIIYYFAPDVKDRKWHWVTPGSVVGILLLLTVCVGVRIYFHYAGSYSAVYGSLGAVIVLLVCFYSGGFAILSGGALNGVLKTLAAETQAQVRILNSLLNILGPPILRVLQTIWPQTSAVIPHICGNSVDVGGLHLIKIRLDPTYSATAPLEAAKNRMKKCCSASSTSCANLASN